MGGSVIKNVNLISIIKETKNNKPSYKQVLNKKLSCLQKRNQTKTFKLTHKTDNKPELNVLKITRESNENLEDFDLLFKSLENQFFTRNIDKELLISIIKSMSLCFVQKDTIVFKQGEIGNYFYIVKEGILELSINQKFVKKLSNGDYFGELALLHEAPRSGTVKCLENSEMYVLERERFRKILNQINEINFEENKKFLESISILANIDNDQKMILIQNLVKETHNRGVTIVKEGEIGSCMYIIKEGEVNCLSQGYFIRTLKKGDYFGERCLWIDNIRTMDVVTNKETVLYSVSIETLKQMMGIKYKEVLVYNILKNAFSKSTYLKSIGTDVIENIQKNMKIINYNKSDIVIPKGYPINTNFFVLIEGRLINGRTNYKMFERGNILFEKNLVYSNFSEIISDDLIADPDCLLAVCDLKILNENLNENIQKVVHKFNLLDTFKKIPLFKTISDSKLKLLSDNIKFEKFEKNQNIITQGDTSNTFYIIKSGKVDIFINGNYARTINENEYFGERSLFFSEPRSATAKAKETVETYTLDQNDFKAIFEDGLKNYLFQRLNLQDNVELDDLDYVKSLGSGNYGHVYLVVSRKNNCHYALKAIPRLKVDIEELHSYLELEKNILLQIDNPFIVKLVKTLGDATYIYFLLEFVKGKELWSVIRDIGLLNKRQTQFYGASMLLALNYLHERYFIHRDIKPENILITETGFIKLIDFGTAKKIVDRASTIIGSPHYMAPEVIMGVGYTFSVDIWSTAVCMFEFKCGVLPFGNDEEDPMSVYVSIVKKDLNFPKYVKDKEFISLMKLMLNKNPMNRLFKLIQIKQHVWFTGFDWNALSNLEIEPPYQIKSLNLIDSDRKGNSFKDFIQNQEEYVPTKKFKKLDKIKSDYYEKWHREF